MECASALRPYRAWLLLLLLSLVPCFVLWPTPTSDQPSPGGISVAAATGSSTDSLTPEAPPDLRNSPQTPSSQGAQPPKPPLPPAAPATQRPLRPLGPPGRTAPPAEPAEGGPAEKRLTMAQQQEIMAKVQLLSDGEVRRELRAASQSDRGAPEEAKRRLTAYWLALAENRGVVSDPMQLYREPTAYCTWSQPNASFKFRPETETEHALALLELLRHVEAVWHRQLGYLYAFADGAYLGAWRHGGLIPHDTDIDIFLFLRANQTRFDFLDQARPLLPQGAIALHDISRTRHVGERAAHYYPPTRGRLQLVHLRRNASMDVSVFTPEKLSNKFSPLCHCRFAPLVGLCFERAEKYLFLAYGAGFRRPHQAHTQRIDLLNYNGR
eukprot:EG_transcript_11204